MQPMLTKTTVRNTIKDSYDPDFITADQKHLLDRVLHRIDAAKPEQTEIDTFLVWLSKEVLNEEQWRENADAIGEIICRKLKVLGYLKCEDGVYQKI